MKQHKPNCTCGCPASYHCLDQLETNCTECYCKRYMADVEDDPQSLNEALSRLAVALVSIQEDGDEMHTCLVDREDLRKLLNAVGFTV